jgi:aldehyde dehydrogenase (NAD+)
MSDRANFNLAEQRLLIDGRWADAASGKTFATVNPATEAALAQIAEAGSGDVDIAVRAARRALEHGQWRRMTGAERGRLLRRLANLVERDGDNLVTLEALDAGKPLQATRRQDLPAAIDCLEYYAGWADKISGEVVPARNDALTYVTRQPVGVVAAIVPWNFPMMNAVWKIAPALASGCTVVLKPAELTPLSALRLGQLALEADLPPGVLNILPGFGTITGQALIEHAGIDKISFTGSPQVGKHIMATAAQTCKRVTVELGGKSPNIIFEDADLDAAAHAAGSGIFFNAGQVCSAGSRLLVHESRYAEVVDRLVARAGQIRLGDPFSPGTSMGPLISRAQQQRVLGHVERGRAAGARLACGGAAAGERGFFVEPTVMADADNSMSVAREEIFGPVVTIIPFKDDAEAISIANDSPYSLAAGLWTRDVTRAHQLAQALRAGTVWINTFGPTDTRMPWGGFGGDSGVGRDLGRAALENYTEQKAVWVHLGKAA